MRAYCLEAKVRSTVCQKLSMLNDFSQYSVQLNLIYSCLLIQILSKLIFDMLSA